MDTSWVLNPRSRNGTSSFVVFEQGVFPSRKGPPVTWSSWQPMDPHRPLPRTGCTHVWPSQKQAPHTALGRSVSEVLATTGVSQVPSRLALGKPPTPPKQPFTGTGRGGVGGRLWVNMCVWRPYRPQVPGGGVGAPAAAGTLQAQPGQLPNPGPNPRSHPKEPAAPPRGGKCLSGGPAPSRGPHRVGAGTWEGRARVG